MIVVCRSIGKKRLFRAGQIVVISFVTILPLHRLPTTHCQFLRLSKQKHLSFPKFIKELIAFDVGRTLPNTDLSRDFMGLVVGSLKCQPSPPPNPQGSPAPPVG